MLAIVNIPDKCVLVLHALHERLAVLKFFWAVLRNKMFQIWDINVSSKLQTEKQPQPPKSPLKVSDDVIAPWPLKSCVETPYISLPDCRNFSLSTMMNAAAFNSVYMHSYYAGETSASIWISLHHDRTIKLRGLDSAYTFSRGLKVSLSKLLVNMKKNVYLPL